MKVTLMTQADIKTLSVVQDKQFEILDWRLYDRLNIAHGNVATTFRFFQQSIGNPVGTTKRVTNMSIQGQLPSGYKFVCEKIALEVRPVSGGVVAGTFLDLAAVTDYGCYEFNIGSRQYLEGDVKELIGGKLFGFGANAAAYAAPFGMRHARMEYSPVIPATFNFDVTVTYDVAVNPAVGVDMICFLIGKIIRPLQG